MSQSEPYNKLVRCSIEGTEERGTEEQRAASRSSNPAKSGVPSGWELAFERRACRPREASAKVWSWDFRRVSQSTSSPRMRAVVRFCSTMLCNVSFDMPDVIVVKADF